MKNISVLSLIEQIPDEASAYRFLEEMRWADKPVCPHCGSLNVRFLEPKNGSTRLTRTGADSPRRVWQCREKECRKQFSVLTGTVFHGSKIPVRTWVFIVFEMVSSKNGVSAREIERKYGLTPKSAWFAAHRVREAMRQGPLAGLLTGEVESDETWVGPKARNVHKGRSSAKVPVLTLIDRQTGEARSRIMPEVTSDSLAAALATEIHPEAVLMTDGHTGYYRTGKTFSEHHAVNHDVKEWARTTHNGRRAGINSAEGFFSQLKGSLDGTFHGVSLEHLPRYLDEFDYRYSTRKMSDSQRMAHLVGRTAGRRLAYKQPRPA
jgi:transposase-like protein